jgi:Bifunctional DNA primase/polymerase, N-terminal
MGQPIVRTETTMLEWALAYASAGYPVFPVHAIRNGACSCGGIAGCKPGKHPVGKLAPRGLLDATIDAGVITSWWHKMPDANIGVPTGRRSGLVVLDVDGPADLHSLLAIRTPLLPWPSASWLQLSRPPARRLQVRRAVEPSSPPLPRPVQFLFGEPS